MKKTNKINNYDTYLEELKRCPFCGGVPKAYLKGNEYTKKTFITVKCTKCGVERVTGSITKDLKWLEDKAINLWNERIK
jgi:Lar family restriction alleviation protein